MVAVICGLARGEKNRWGWHWKENELEQPPPSTLSSFPSIPKTKEKSALHWRFQKTYEKQGRGQEGEQGKNIDLGKVPADGIFWEWRE